MAPIAIDETKKVANGTPLKATARSFHDSRYHASASRDAIAAEDTYAAHNYHPIPVVFARASGCSVWDPVRNPQPNFDGPVLT
jgi:ornithine--oxo-acid transaminase